MTFQNLFIHHERSAEEKQWLATELAEQQVRYDGIVKARQPRLYAEEHHLDGRARKITGIQMPFAADGAIVDWIVEFVFPIEG